MPVNVTIIPGADQVDWYLGNYTYANVVSDMAALKFKLATDLDAFAFKNAAGTTFKILNDASGGTQTTLNRVFHADANGAADATADFVFTPGTGALRVPRQIGTGRVPTSTVDVYNASGNAHLLVEAGSGYSELELIATGSNVARIKYGATALSTDLVFHSSRSGFGEQARLTSDGLLGVGIAVPVSLVHVGSAASGAVETRYTNSTTGVTVNDGFIVGINASEQAEIWNYENTTMRFATNNVLAMTIDTSQRVGILTAAPSCALEVTAHAANENAFVCNISGAQERGFRLIGTGSSIPNATFRQEKTTPSTGSSGSLNFQAKKSNYSVTTIAFLQCTLTDHTNGSVDAQFEFNTQSNSVTSTDLIVGAGDGGYVQLPNDDQKLQFGDSQDASAWWDNSGAAFTLQTSGATSLSLGTNAQSQMNISSAGAYTLNEQALANADFTINKDTSGTAFLVDVSTGSILVNTSTTHSAKVSAESTDPYLEYYETTAAVIDDSSYQALDENTLFYRHSTPAADRQIWSLVFHSKNVDYDVPVEYGRITSVMVSVTDGSEYGGFRFWTRNNGSQVQPLTIMNNAVGCGFDPIAGNGSLQVNTSTSTLGFVDTASSGTVSVAAGLITVDVGNGTTRYIQLYSS